MQVQASGEAQSRKVRRYTRRLTNLQQLMFSHSQTSLKAPRSALAPLFSPLFPAVKHRKSLRFLARDKKTERNSDWQEGTRKSTAHPTHDVQQKNLCTGTCTNPSWAKTAQNWCRRVGSNVVDGKVCTSTKYVCGDECGCCWRREIGTPRKCDLQQSLRKDVNMWRRGGDLFLCHEPWTLYTCSVVVLLLWIVFVLTLVMVVGSWYIVWKALEVGATKQGGDGNPRDCFERSIRWIARFASTIVRSEIITIICLVRLWTFLADAMEARDNTSIWWQENSWIPWECANYIGISRNRQL